MKLSCLVAYLKGLQGIEWCVCHTGLLIFWTGSRICEIASGLNKQGPPIYRSGALALTGGQARLAQTDIAELDTD